MTKFFEVLKNFYMYMTLIIVLSTISIIHNSFNNYENEDKVGMAYAIEDFQEIKLGILMPITGTLSSLGETGVNTVKIVSEDLEHYIQDQGYNYRIKFLIENTKTDPDEALKKLEKLKEKGADIIIGPVSSSSTWKVKDYADNNNIIIFSFSTSHTLTNHDDNIFRLLPDDSNQAQAISEKMWNDGIKVVVPISRSDIYGNDLLNHTKTNFEILGGTMVDGIKYTTPVGNLSTSNKESNLVFGKKELITLDSKVKTLTDNYPLNEIGIYLIAFDEIISIFNNANSYPILEQIRWYGSETNSKFNEIIINKESALFAFNSEYVAPSYGFNETNNENFDKYIDKYYDLYSKDSFTFAGPFFYDSVWLATLSKLETNNTNDIEALKRVLQNISNSYNGLTGLTILNDAGNRINGIYEFWTVERDEKETDKFKWVDTKTDVTIFSNK